MKKILLFTATLLTAVTIYSQAPNTWTRKADLPAAVRFAGVGFTIESKGYTGTGYNGTDTYYHEFCEYDPDNNSWSQKADLPAAGRYSAVGFSIGKKGYIGTGAQSWQCCGL